jgi:hypothetical protein
MEHVMKTGTPIAGLKPSDLPGDTDSRQEAERRVITEVSKHGRRHRS